MRALVPFSAFFASGASSLIFQAIWTRMLHHVFGATSVAMSTVLSVFMAGLGLGAYWFGRRATRLARPLFAYALCELGVALSALLLPWLVRPEGPLSAVNAWLRVTMGAESTTFMLARFACVVPLLIVPTTLMGGTLPLLCAHFVPRDASAADAGASVGRLYAINTLGAVTGTLIGNFVLLPWVGVSTTHAVAIGMNVALGLVVLAFVKARSAKTHTDAAERVASAERPATLTPTPLRTRRLAIFTFALSGACALAYEVVWSRALAMAIGSSMQSFALILVTFLIGIAAGSAFVAPQLSARPRLGRIELAPYTFVCIVGCAIALLPAAVLSSTTTAGLALAGCVASALALVELATRSAVAEQALGASTEPVAKKFERLLLAIPCGVSLFECVRFATVKSSLPAVSLHGYLPFVAAAVVCVIALSAALVSALRNELTLLSSAMQLSIASSTLVGYLFQDEIPYVFARLVSALDDLPDHVALVRFFMFFTAGLCTLPATLGMGAMFPITMRLCSGGGREVGRDVAVVYSANTLGSIAGAWLPGFVLMPLLGIERTLHAGMLLNVGLAAIMLLASRLEGSQRERELHAGGERDEAVDAASGSTAGALSVTLHLATLVCAALLIWLAAGPSSALRWNLSHMTLGAFRVSLARNVLDPVAWGEPDLVYYRDGLSTTVSVERWGRHLSLKNNGKVDASNGDDMPTQIAVAAYPLLLHASHGRGIDVAIVGFGSGVTVGAALQFPLEKLDAMELERGVVEAAARFFADVNHLPHAQATFPFVRAPRLSLTNDDGRNYLSATDQTYDVIISEPSNPWITGVSDLFTVEHFQVSKRKLRPGGMYCQWVQLYEMSPSNVKTIYRTFASQFRYVVAFSAEELSSDTILIGSDSPIPLDVRALAEAMQPAAVQKELRRAFIDTPYDVLARLLFVSKEEILAFAQLEERERDGRFVLDDTAMGDGPCPAKSCRRRPAPLNTDDNMWIELRAPADLIGFARYQGYLRLFYGDAFPYGALLSKVTGLDTDERKAALAEALLAHGRKRRASELVKTLRASDARGVQDVARMTALFAADAPSPALTLPQGAMGPQLPEGLARELASVDALGARYVAEGQPGKALALLEALDPAFSSQRGPAARAAFGVLCYVAAKGDRDRLRRAVQEIETAAREAPELLEQHPELWYVLARAHDALASFHRATDSMRAYVTRMAH